jgi:hypothetical protein
MKLAFEGPIMRFYDDGTWIVATSDGGIRATGEWRIDDDALMIGENDGRGDATEWSRASEWDEAACREWRERLGRQVAAAIVGSHGRNY